jgi:uncharacterized membrane protein YgdD (TMEM256/DUF423 family)
MVKSRLITGIFMVLLSVILGATAAHSLPKILPEPSVISFKTGVDYLQLIGLVLMLGSLEKLQMHVRVSRILVASVFCFSGSIFVLAFKSKIGFSVSFLGPITPIGGLLMMLGLGIWAWKVWKA